MQKEAKARIKINELLQNAGWRFFDGKSGTKNIEVEGNVNLESLGDDFEHGTGFIDYLLLDTKGFPLAVLEAKSQSKDPVVGKKQAEDYAKAKRCRFVILSNGDTHYFWDLNQNAEKIILKFPTQKDLTKLLTATTAMPLSGIDVKDEWIVQSQGAVAEADKKYLRDYQLDAIQTIASKFDSGNRRFLLEMATGTGKTLVSAGVIKLFLKTGNGKRILFLVDRLELEDQAHKNFKKILHNDFTSVIYKENRDDWQKAEFPPNPPSAFLLLKWNGNGKHERAKIPSPQPPSFLPACLGFAPKTFGRTDGGTEKKDNTAVKALAPPSRACAFGFFTPFLLYLYHIFWYY